MTRYERLMHTLRGEPVDRPAVCFYEIDKVRQQPENPDPFNIYHDPSWRPLLDLAWEKSDIISLTGVGFNNWPESPLAELTTTESSEDSNGSRISVRKIRTAKNGGRVLTQRCQRDRDIDTTWVTEHLLKDVDDFKAYLDLPLEEPAGAPDITSFLAKEKKIGDRGLTLIDTSDPLCNVAPLFSMADFTVIALTEPELMHRALERAAKSIYYCTEAIAKALPGRLWRIYGPEYASPPYLPPRLFHDYVTRYVQPQVEMIQRYGGYARIHCHGKLRLILDEIAATGCSGLDPIEPPPQGDVELSYVRERYGKQLVLFGNLEVSDIETLPTAAFTKKVETALREGTAGTGRGFVLMPSAAPYGRHLAPRTIQNYEKMVELTEKFG